MLSDRRVATGSLENALAICLGAAGRSLRNVSQAAEQLAAKRLLATPTKVRATSCHARNFTIAE
jgi:hypothetical protein